MCAKSSFTIWGDDLESCLLKHRGSAMCGLVAEGAGFPMGDGVGFDQTASTVANALQRGCQGCSRDALSAVALVHHEAGDSPEFSTADGESQSLIFPAV